MVDKDKYRHYFPHTENIENNEDNEIRTDGEEDDYSV
jgi:hypothetical protein